MLVKTVANMKTILILGVIFAYAWATSEPVNIPRLTAAAIHRCSEEKSLNEDHLKEYFKNKILPEDDAEFTDFFVCFWQEMGILKKDGTFAHKVMEDFIRHGLQSGFPNIADPFTTAKDVVEHCKDTPQADNIGLRGIQYRNCVTKYLKNLVQE